jgi:PKD repeat protein
MKTRKILSLLGLLSFIFFISCTKEDTPKPKPTAVFTASDSSVVVGQPIIFANTSENATSFSWSFGDGTTSTDTVPTKAYNAIGTYTVTLVVTGPGGTMSATHSITVIAATIYFMDSSDELMEKLVLDGTGTVTTFLDLAGKSGVGIAFDNVNNKIYYSDFFDADTPNGKIWKMNIDGTGATAIVTGILDPYGIALDVAGNKVYWTDDNGNISTSNLDGTNPQIGIVNVVDGGMRAVAIDKANNKMYFYEVQNDNLYVSNLDGTNKSVLITGIYGYALFIDTVNGKLYFDDEYGPALKRANLDGTNVVEIYKNPDAAVGKSRIYGIAIDNDINKLYWSCRDAGEIYQANLDGTSKVTLATGLTSPRGLFLKK